MAADREWEVLVSAGVVGGNDPIRVAKALRNPDGWHQRVGRNVEADPPFGPTDAVAWKPGVGVVRVSVGVGARTMGEAFDMADAAVAAGVFAEVRTADGRTWEVDTEALTAEPVGDPEAAAEAPATPAPAGR